MADKFDGSININSRVNTEGFEKGVKEIEDGVKRIAKSVNDLGNAMKSAGVIDTKGSVQALDQLGKKAEETAAKVADANKAPAAGDGGASAQPKITLPVGKPDEKGFEQGTEEMRQACESLQQQAEETRDSLNSIFMAPVEGLNEADDPFAEFAKQLQEAEQMRAEMQAGAGEYQDDPPGRFLGDDLGAKFDAIKAKVAGLVSAAGKGAGQIKQTIGQAFSAASDKAIQGIQSIPGAMARVGESVKGTVKNAANSFGTFTTSAANAAAGIRSKIAGVASGAFNGLKTAAGSAVAGIKTAFSNVGAAVGAAMSGIKAKIAGIHPAFAVIGQVGGTALKTVAAAAVKAGSGLAKLAGKGIIAGIHGIAGAAQKAAVSLGNMAKNAASGAFNKLKNSFLGIGKSSNDMSGGLKHGFTTLLKYGFGIRSVYYLFRKLRTALMEGFSALMQYDSSLANDVNNLKASLMGLRNAFAAALAPLAQMVIPVLTSIINTIAGAVNQIGMLIAALTGKGSYIRATQQQAAATGGAADAFKDETKAAKEAKKTIAGFDDLTILDEDDNDNAAGAPGGGGGAGGGGVGFEEVPIDNKMSDLAKMLKDMWAKGDFTELGKMVGEKLRDALNKIPWDVIKEFARKLATSIATFLNGFLEVPGLFDAIGRTIAEALNTAFEFVNAFARAFHWDSLGFAIRDGILGVLNNLDWGVIYSAFMAVGTGIGTALEAALDNPEIWIAIATTFSHQVTALVLAIQGFFGAVDWASLGHNIGLGLNAGVESFPWLGIADVITTALNSVFSLLYNFLTTFDFYSMGSHVGQMLTEAITTFDWNTAGASFAALINALFDLLNGLVVETDWKALGAGVIDAIAGFFGEFDWASVGSFISNCLLGLFNFLTGALEAVNWAEVPGQIVTKIGEFLSGFDWGAIADAAMGLLGAALGAALSVIVNGLIMAGGAIYEAFKNIIDGGLQGIIDGLKSIGAWIKEHIFTPFIDGFKSVFGIASPSTEMKTLGGYLIDGLFGGILEPLKNIGSWLSEHVGGPIIGGVKKLFGIGEGEPALEGSGKGLVEGLKEGVGGVISGIGGWIKNNVTDPVANAVTTNFGTDKTAVTQENGKGLVEGLKDGMGNVMSGIGSWIKGNVTDPVAEAVTTNLGTDKTAVTEANGKGMIEGLKNGMKAGMQNITDFVTSTVTTPLVKAIETPLGIKESGGDAETFVTIGSEAMESLKNGIEENTEDIIDTLSDLADNMPEPFDDVDWDDIGVNICEGINDGIHSRWDWLESQAYNLAIDMYNAACRSLGIASPSKKFYWIAEMITAGLSGGLEDTAGDAVDAVNATAQAVTAEAEKASPIIPIDTALTDPLSQLDATMYDFADKVVGGFEAMIAALQEIASHAAFTVPQAAMGSLAPYTARAAAGSGSRGDDPEAVMQLIAALRADRLTRDDLAEILENVAREHFNFDFYIGNEQVARAANAGNARLNRRYRTTQA